MQSLSNDLLVFMIHYTKNPDPRTSRDKNIKKIENERLKKYQGLRKEVEEF